MTSRRLDDDDVLAAASRSSAAQGFHEMGGRTNLFIGDDDDVAKTEMVSRHELAHANLNRTTIYGDLLWLVAVDLEGRPGSDPSRLGELVDVARLTHECFATSFGLWLTRGDPDALLSPYPQYAKYLALARELTNGLPDHSMGGLTVIESVARAAMQAPIRELLGGRERLAAASVGDLPPAYRPDQRFRILVGSGRDFTTPLAEEELWRVPLTSVDPDRLEGEAFARRNTELAAAIFAICSEVLEVSAGFPTAGFDAHMQGVPGLESRVARRYERDPDRPPLINYGSRERVYLREYRPELIVVPIEEYLAETAQLPANVIVTRPTSRVIEQYALNTGAEQLLSSTASHGFTTGLRFGVGPQRGRSVLLAVIDNPSAARVLGETLIERGEPAISNISMTALASLWRDEWWSAMPNPTLLADAHPFAVIDILKKTLRDSPDLASAACAGWRIQRSADRSHVTGAYLRLSPDVKTADPGLITIAVTTSTLTRELLELWQSPSTLEATEDDPLHVRHPLIAELLGNLAEEEPWFDFDAFHPAEDRP